MNEKNLENDELENVENLVGDFATEVEEFNEIDLEVETEPKIYNEGVIDGDRIETICLENDEMEFDISELEFAQSPCITRGVAGSGVLSIVKTEKYGKRITLSKELVEKLGTPSTVQIGYMKNAIIISERLAENQINYKLSNHGTKKVIYTGDLIKEITSRYALDYSNKTSITFHDVEYKIRGDYSVAIISIL